MNRDEFFNEQKIIYNFFTNSLKNKHFPHAILLYGDSGSPIEDTAKFLAKSLLCEEDLACETCKNCKKFDDGQLDNYVSIDGRQEFIKKEQINNLIEQFVLTRGEENPIAIYSIYEVSNMRNEASNALLKFLEEPPKDVYAILTTTRKEKILSTILSRVISLKVLPHKYKDEEVLSSKDSYLRLKLHLSLCEEEDTEDAFSSAYEAANKFLTDYVFNEKKSFNELFQMLQTLKGNLCYNYFYSIIYQVFIDVLENNLESPFKDSIIGLQNHCKEIFNATTFLEEVISNAKLNFSPALVVGRLVWILEGNHE